MPFNSFEFRSFAQEWGFQVNTSSPNYPRSNGFIERMVGVAKAILKKSQQKKIDKEYILLEYRNSPILGSPYTPSQLLLSRSTRSIYPIHERLLRPNIVRDFEAFQKKKTK